MNAKLQPFSVSYSREIPVLLHELKCSLALSTYQAGKVILISALDAERLIQLPRTFDNAMGLAYSNNKLAVACKTELVILKNSPQTAPNYPLKPNTYDALFLPRCSFNTGTINLHDMNFGGEKLLVVNTLFSCLAEINPEFSFQPFWQPKFITELKPEDRCHLNGMAMGKSGIEYVTALGKTNAKGGWRENKIKGGVIVHVPTNTICVEGLSMPHSPRIYNDKLYFLNSAQGDLCVADPAKGSFEKVVHLGGFARGMSRIGDYLFIGVSRLRHTTEVFKDLPISKTSFAGVVVVYLPYGSIVGRITYENSVDEIYDVKVLPDMQRPGILNTQKEESSMALVTPTDTYWAMPEPKK